MIKWRARLPPKEPGTCIAMSNSATIEPSHPWSMELKLNLLVGVAEVFVLDPSGIITWLSGIIM